MSNLRYGVICHGDCDGVISAFLYIKHYMRDSYPSNIEIIFTQPWRAHIDSKRLNINGLAKVVLLDIAINEELIKFLQELSSKVPKITVIDHHISSKPYISRLRELGIEVIWDKAPSTPHLIRTSLCPYVNPYEEFLINVADVCEGNESKNQEVVKVADLIKLSIARDPGDINYLNYLVKAMIEGKDLSRDHEVIKRAKIAKFLLKRLLKVMSEKALEVKGIKIVPLDLPESRIYAGLLGIATTEFMKMYRKDVALIRKEEKKIVVTVRSITDRAFNICRELALRLRGKFGGHAEAASTTLPDMPLDKAVSTVVEVLRSCNK